MTTRQQRQAAVSRGRLQPVRGAREGRADRPAHRLGHRRDEPRPVGRDPARRRVLRRLAVVLRVPGRRARAVPVRARDPHPPGPGGREDPLQRPRGAWEGGAEQHALRHHPGQRRVHRGAGRRPGHRGGPRPAGRPPVQGQHGRRGTGRVAARARGRRPGRVRDDHQQQRRWAAGVAGQPARGPRGVRRARQAAVPRRLPLRRERLVHPRARAGAGRPRRDRHRARDGIAGRRHDDERQEGPDGQHRRMAGDGRRRTGPGLPEPADPHRRVPDLRRVGRPRPRGAGAGAARSRRSRLPAIPDPLDRRTSARRCSEPECRC